VELNHLITAAKPHAFKGKNAHELEYDNYSQSLWMTSVTFMQ
jgi:hypothetical protein